MVELSDLSATIAREVRAGRHMRGWTLETLASRSGVSKGALVAIEQGRGNPSIATLCRIADALGVAMARLVEMGDAPAVRVIPPERTVRMWSGAAGGHGTLVLGSDSPVELEVWDWQFEPGESHEGEPHPPGMREVVYVLSGTLTLRAGPDEARVPAGGAALFPADQPHTYANEQDEPTRFVMVVEAPPAG